MAKGLAPNGDIVEVPEDLFRIRDEIEARWPNLWVTYLNPDHPTSAKRVGLALGDAPFAIWERTSEGPRFVLSVWKLDQSVIDKLQLVNGANGDVLERIEKENAKLRKDLTREHEEVFAEGADMMKSMIRRFGEGKLQFSYTNEHGEKRVVKEGYNGRDRKTKVL
jgi:hypothetical protein